MMRNLRAKGIMISDMRDWRKLRTLFEDNAMIDVLEFIEKTEVGKRPAAEASKVDPWEIERLDRSGDEEEGAVDKGGE
jgi:hypothetical protein